MQLEPVVRQEQVVQQGQVEHLEQVVIQELAVHLEHLEPQEQLKRSPMF